MNKPKSKNLPYYSYIYKHCRYIKYRSNWNLIYLVKQKIKKDQNKNKIFIIYYFYYMVFQLNNFYYYNLEI